jgi:hypothetical protein
MNKSINMVGGCSIEDAVPKTLLNLVSGTKEGASKMAPQLKFVADLCLFIAIFPLIPLFYIMAIGLSAFKYLLLKLSSL